MVSTSGNQKGGGYVSRQHVETKVRTGSGNKSARPAGTAQIGTAIGDHITTYGGGDSGYRGERLHNPERNPSMSVPFGNEVALNVGKGGCGTGRTLYGQAGSQGTHGATNPGSPRPPGRGILTNE
jgi:hypothetical protein